MVSDVSSMPLMTPGPTSMSPAVAEALARPMLFHRSPHFRELFARVSAKLTCAFGASDAYRTLILSGSGTLANESVIASVFNERDRVLIPVNGEFGERLVHLCTVHGVDAVPLEMPWATPIDLDRVDRALTDRRITAVAMVAMETSTGMLNPYAAIGRRCRASGRLLFVDAISALGAEDLAIERDGIDICTSVPNKGLGGPPGLGLVCARRAVLQARRPARPSSVYLDLYRYLDAAEHNETPTTPAVSLIASLEVALDQFLAEGPSARRGRYLALSRQVRAASAAMGIDALVPEETDAAVAVTTLCLPAGVDATELQRSMQEQGITVWKPASSGGTARNDLLQVAVMGEVDAGDVERFIDALRAFLVEERGREVAYGRA